MGAAGDQILEVAALGAQRVVDHDRVSDGDDGSSIAGVDLPSVRNIVLFRRIGSMPLFKQIIGRGTRLCLEAHKGSFDIIDFVEATRLVNDPAFDGPPLRVIDDEADELG